MIRIVHQIAYPASPNLVNILKNLMMAHLFIPHDVETNIMECADMKTSTELDSPTSYYYIVMKS